MFDLEKFFVRVKQLHKFLKPAENALSAIEMQHCHERMHFLSHLQENLGVLFGIETKSEDGIELGGIQSSKIEAIGKMLVFIGLYANHENITADDISKHLKKMQSKIQE